MGFNFLQVSVGVSHELLDLVSFVARLPSELCDLAIDLGDPGVFEDVFEADSLFSVFREQC